MTLIRVVWMLTLGWLLGVWTTLSWVWIGEGKTALQSTGGMYLASGIVSTMLSVILLGVGSVLLVNFTFTGQQDGLDS